MCEPTISEACARLLAVLDNEEAIPFNLHNTLRKLLSYDNIAVLKELAEAKI